jgi:uncharacterized protein (DUF2461 family)
MNYKTVTVDVDVDVDLDDFSDKDLIDELKYRGFSVNKDGSTHSWLKPSLVEEELDSVLWKLRESYMIDNADQFHKSFKNILAEYGYHI